MHPSTRARFLDNIWIRMRGVVVDTRKTFIWLDSCGRNDFGWLKCPLMKCFNVTALTNSWNPDFFLTQSECYINRFHCDFYQCGQRKCVKALFPVLLKASKPCIPCPLHFFLPFHLSVLLLSNSVEFSLLSEAALCDLPGLVPSSVTCCCPDIVLSTVFINI